MSFDEFFKYPWYVEFKNFTANYLHRKKAIRREMNNPKGFVLDIGSGISPIIPINAYSILGDISPTAVEIMRKRGAYSCVLDITNIEYNDNCIDMVVCSEVLEHIQDDKKAINEMKRILKKGGILILTVPIYNYYWLKDDTLVGHLRRYEPKKIVKEIEDAGFEILKAKMIGSLTERLTTCFITTLFLSSGNFSKEPPKFIKKVLGVYKKINLIWANVLMFTSKITHPKLSSIMLVKCRKTN